MAAGRPLFGHRVARVWLSRVGIFGPVGETTRSGGPLTIGRALWPLLYFP
jgi:hypothetical protein